MKKKFLLTTVLALGLSSALSASDYSSYTTEELIEMKGTVPVEEREQFRAELKHRFELMTPDERAQYDIGQQLGGEPRGGGNGTGDGSGNGRKAQDGTGSGSNRFGGNGSGYGKQ
jgi:hypothetical protein